MVALVLSLLVPGLGQSYNGEHRKGLFIFVVCALCGGMAFWLSGINHVSLLLGLLIVWASAIVDAYKTAQTSGRSLDWPYRRSYVVTMLLLLGPLALPLLWQSPHFSRVAQTRWTIVVVSVALLFLVTPYFVQLAIQRVPELATLLQQSGL